MTNKKNRYMDTRPHIEANRLRVIFKYMFKNNLDHDSLMEEILEKRCELSASVREYVILRDFLGNKITTEIPKKDESIKDISK